MLQLKGGRSIITYGLADHHPPTPKVTIERHSLNRFRQCGYRQKVVLSTTLWQ
jgi:hypothetical protein